MNSVNHILILGHLTRNPRLTHLPSGKTVCDFALALNRLVAPQHGRFVERDAGDAVIGHGHGFRRCSVASASSILSRWRGRKGVSRGEAETRRRRVSVFAQRPQRPQRGSAVGGGLPVSQKDD